MIKFLLSSVPKDPFEITITRTNNATVEWCVYAFPNQNALTQTWIWWRPLNPGSWFFEFLSNQNIGYIQAEGGGGVGWWVTGACAKISSAILNDAI